MILCRAYINWLAPLLFQFKFWLSSPVRSYVMLHPSSGTLYLRQFSKALVQQFSDLDSRIFYSASPFPTDLTAIGASEVMTLWYFRIMIMIICIIFITTIIGWMQKVKCARCRIECEELELSIQVSLYCNIESVLLLLLFYKFTSLWRDSDHCSLLSTRWTACCGHSSVQVTTALITGVCKVNHSNKEILFLLYNSN